MAGKKFSITLDDETQADVARFVELWNMQFLIKLKPASAIRALIRQGIKHQQLVPSFDQEEDEWLHLEAAWGTACGAKSKKTTPLESELHPTCPTCIRKKRHAGPMVPSD
jgi:hypothetical protein